MMCPAAEIVQGQRVEPLHHLLLKIEPQGADDLMAERAPGRVADWILRGFESSYRADDVTETYSSPFTGETIAAARTADSEKDLVPDPLLQHRFEVAARDPLALGYLGRPYRRPTTIVSNVQHRLDREKQFLG